MVNPVPHLITEEYIGNLMLSEARQVSFCNGDYWWELDTPAKNAAYTELHCDAQDFFDQIIDEREFVIRLYKYFQVVYNESLDAWKAKYERKPSYFGPIPDVKIGLRELRYINERWGQWCEIDGEDNEARFDYVWDNYRAEIFTDSPIHNDVLDSEYEDIRPSGLISSLDWQMPFGKHKGSTLRAILCTNADYLEWFMRSNDKFKFSPELQKTIRGQVQKEAFWD